MPTALITGVTGQDGSYLAENLLHKGYDVVGMVRRSSTVNYERIAHIQGNLKFVNGDLLDQISLIDAIKLHESDEIYNLAAQSHVRVSPLHHGFSIFITGEPLNSQMPNSTILTSFWSPTVLKPLLINCTNILPSFCVLLYN